MRKYIVQMAETRNFEIPVIAAGRSAAIQAAREKWGKEPTTGQWEVDGAETEIVSVTEAAETK